MIIGKIENCGYESTKVVSLFSGNVHTTEKFESLKEDLSIKVHTIQAPKRGYKRIVAIYGKANGFTLDFKYTEEIDITRKRFSYLSDKAVRNLIKYSFGLDGGEDMPWR